MPSSISLLTSLVTVGTDRFHFMAQIRDTEIPSHDVVSDQLQFQQSGFIAFFGLSQKRIDHNSQ